MPGAHLERADECLDAGYLVVLPIEHAPEQWRPQPQRHIACRHGAPEQGLENRLRLDTVELRAVHEPACRLEEAGLEELDRGGDAEEQRERNPRAPRAATSQQMLPHERA